MRDFLVGSANCHDLGSTVLHVLEVKDHNLAVFPFKVDNYQFTFDISQVVFCISLFSLPLSEQFEN